MDFYLGEGLLNHLAALLCLSVVYFQGFRQSPGQELVLGPYAKFTPQANMRGDQVHQALQQWIYKTKYFRCVMSQGLVG